MKEKGLPLFPWSLLTCLSLETIMNLCSASTARVTMDWIPEYSVYSVQGVQCVQCIVYTVYRVYSVQGVQCVQCTVCTVYSVYSVQGVYTVQCRDEKCTEQPEH